MMVVVRMWTTWAGPFGLFRSPTEMRLRSVRSRMGPLMSARSPLTEVGLGSGVGAGVGTGVGTGVGEGEGVTWGAPVVTLLGTVTLALLSSPHAAVKRAVPRERPMMKSLPA